MQPAPPCGGDQGVYLCIKLPHTTETGDGLLPYEPCGSARLGIVTPRIQVYMSSTLRAKVWASRKVNVYSFPAFKKAAELSKVLYHAAIIYSDF